MRLTFPTGNRGRHGVIAEGEPDRAKACKGHTMLLVDGRCLWCGRLPKDTIDGTWAARARSIERARR